MFAEIKDILMENEKNVDVCILRQVQQKTKTSDVVWNG